MSVIKSENGFYQVQINCLKIHVPYLSLVVLFTHNKAQLIASWWFSEGLYDGVWTTLLKNVLGCALLPFLDFAFTLF